LAGCYGEANRRANAAQAIQKALDVLTELSQRRPLRPSEEDQRKEAVQRLTAWTK
jgi:hypothetical protein